MKWADSHDSLVAPVTPEKWEYIEEPGKERGRGGQPPSSSPMLSLSETPRELVQRPLLCPGRRGAGNS